MSDKFSRYQQLAQDPRVRGLLNTIRYAEGTSGEAGYRTMFGGGKFTDMSRHPDQVVNSGGYKSAAAGGYQFLPSTWQGIAKQLGLKSFDPQSQDIAAVGLIDRRGALDPFLRGEKFGTVINKLAPEWASLPTSAGGSYYGQPSKPLGELYNVYQQQKKAAGVPVGTQPAVQPSGSQRSVEDILSSAFRGTAKPGLEKKNSIADAMKTAAIESVLLPGLFNFVPFNPLGFLS